MAARWSPDDIPDQSGRTAIVTGASGGLGLATATELARAGATVVLAVRNPEKGERARATIAAAAPAAPVEVRIVDVADLASVRAAAEELRAAHPRIDLLVNNAGVMYTPKQVTPDGFELQLGTNHLGAFALTGLLLPAMLEVEGSRVVAVSSVGHRINASIHFDDLQWEKRYDRVAAYGQSKLANLLFTYALQRRLDAAGAPTIAVASHPGLSDTELIRNMPAVLRLPTQVVYPLIAQSAERGAHPTLRAATDPAVAGGEYYGPSGFQETRGHAVKVGSSAQSHDEAIQDRLWDVSEELTGVTFPV
jgi:NAD(P)-dependent dehydrogenase (short-subunit alcohol dehydrogenase family)